MRDYWRKARSLRRRRVGTLAFSCLLFSCNQSTNFSKLEIGEWQERYDNACHMSPQSKKFAVLAGEFQFDGEGEFPDALAVGSKRYLTIFKRNFYEPSASENFEATVASPHRMGIRGIVYDGKTTCRTSGELDGAVFVRSVGQPTK